ncbi:MAG: glucokinase [Myxococcales bacterium]|nr:glucokinase [Myxococcales bacterium]
MKTINVLAGDIGGTKTLLALFRFDGDGREEIASERFTSADFDGLDEIVQRFLSGQGLEQVDAASFGVAGPVVADEARLPNLPWLVRRRDLVESIPCPRVALLNDFAAVGYGLSALARDDLVELQPGTPGRDAPIAVIGAGTGLGQGFLLHDGAHYRVHPSEGGHASFAPQNELQCRLHGFLAKTYDGHVSVERVVSGQGLVNIYRFLVESEGRPELTMVREQMQSEDVAAVISRHAQAQSDPTCDEALGIFCELYGAEAGNLALKVMATGGVYVAGGIAPRIVERMQDGRFVTAFRSKGRMRPLLEAIPVDLVNNPLVGLLGSAVYARRLVD